MMPFFWARFVASALLAGSVFAGCAAGGGEGDDVVDEPSTPTAPARPVTTPATTGTGTGSGTPAATGGTPVTTEVTPVGTEQPPAPSRDAPACP